MPGAFQPTNVGREYGTHVPIAVTHLWGYGARGGGHWPGQQIICFNYGCRLMVGKKKDMKAITYKDFKKRVAKNAKKGAYKTPVRPPNPKSKRDSTRKPVVKPDTVVARKAPETKTAAPVAPILKADSLITLGDFLFETNSFKLKNEHYAALDSLGKFLSAHPSLEVAISGHTDNTGNERHNVSLSLRRAEVVSEYLMRIGLSVGKVTYEGFGSSKPIAENDTATGRGKNRRVEILIKKPEP